MPSLVKWNNFYVIIGSAAGALIGLQFVALSLIAQRTAQRAADAGAAFATPTIVHFTSVLFLSALLCAPWQSITAVAVLCGLIGLNGVAYDVIVARRMRKQSAYQPVFEDWLFHAVLPFAAYGILTISPFAVRFHMRGALFGIGAAALLLLFIGIHNTWDGLVYHVFDRGGAETDQRLEEVSKQELS